MKRSDSAYEKTEFAGEWWFPETPDVRLHGTLTGSIADRLTLDVEGSFEDFDLAKPDRIVLGETKEGRAVTLLQCWLKGQHGHKGPNGKRLSTYYVHWALVGAHFKEYSELTFRMIRFGLHLLEEWHNQRAFDCMALETAIYSGMVSDRPAYSRPAPVKLGDADGITLTLEYDAKTNGMSVGQKELTIAHAARILLEASDEELPLANFGGQSDSFNFFDAIDSLTSLLSLATSASVFPYAMEAFSDRFAKTWGSVTRPVPIEILRIRKLPAVPQKRFWWDMDLPWKYLENSPETYVNEWLAKVHGIAMPISLYLEAASEDDAYEETRFSFLCQALEGYHRYANAGTSKPSKEQRDQMKSILDAAPLQHRKWLRDKLQFSHEPSLRKRLRNLCERYPETVKWLVGPRKKVKILVSLIVKHRHDLAHCLQGQRPTRSGGAIQKAQESLEIMKTMMFMCFLTEMGFTKDQIDEIVRGNRRLQQFVEQREAPPNPKRIHVSGTRGEWSVMPQGGFEGYRATTKAEAIQRGREMARERHGQLIVHREDGKVQAESNYSTRNRKGNVPRNKGRKGMPMPKRKRMHVTGKRGQWKGLLEGNEKASFTAITKQEAIDKGRVQMEKAHGQLIVHKADGTFQEERTYGNDPYPPKG